MKTFRTWLAAGALMLAVTASAVSSPDAQLAAIRAARAWIVPTWSDAQQAASAAKHPPDEVLRLPGSTRHFTRARFDSYQLALDWWPHDHPPLPHVVEYGNGKAMPCALCHLPNGAGERFNAPLAGLPEAYILEQLQAFRQGTRRSAEMHLEATGFSEAELHQAAAYYAGLRMPAGRTRVIETAQVPRTRVDFFMQVPVRGGGVEPIGERIVETSQNLAHTALRDERTGFIAWVPPGSLARGSKLATAGDDGTTACVACHGEGLRGVANIPPLAGRSPTYLLRQLVKFRLGRRGGPAAAPMQQEVSRLSLGDMIAVVAYSASLPPGGLSPLHAGASRSP